MAVECRQYQPDVDEFAGGDGGWTVRQLVGHVVAGSAMAAAIVRALT